MSLANDYLNYKIERIRLNLPYVDYDDWLASYGPITRHEGMEVHVVEKLTPSAERKATPIFSGFLKYFPLACAAAARLSKKGNDKHNPGEPLHWSREKSTDHGDCIVRHQMEFDQIDPETGEFHAVGVLWRAAAQLELLEEKRLGK